MKKLLWLIPLFFLTNAEAATTGEYVNFGDFLGENVSYYIAGCEDINGDGISDYLLFSEKILTHRAFDKSTNRWSESSLREWLNSESGFLSEENFSSAERERILPVKRKTVLPGAEHSEGGNEMWRWNDGGNTDWRNALENYDTAYYETAQDLVVIPSVGELVRYTIYTTFSAPSLIFIGLAMSALMNILLPIFPSPYLMIIFWAVNGLAQALIYPPLMRIISHYLSELDYAKACLFVTIGSHIATLLMYLISPAAIVISGWKLVFFFSGGCAVVFLVIWQLYSMHIKKKYGSVLKCSKVDNKTRETSKNVSTKELFVSSGLLIIMLAVVMQGVLREGITAWMPAYLSDIFSLNNEISILTTVILPIFSIFSAYVILTIRTRLCKNELKLACITFFVAFASIVTLLIVRTNMSLTVLLLALTSACAHAVNFLLICLVPVKFEKYSKFTLVTGVINSCTYVGAAISTYGVAAVSENFGWNVTLCLWGVIAFIGMICCSVVLKHWNKA